MRKGKRLEPHIYQHPDGNRLITLVKVPMVRDGKKTTLPREAVHETIEDARAWVYSAKADRYRYKSSDEKTEISIGECSCLFLEEQEEDGYKSIGDTRRHHKEFVGFFGADTPLKNVDREFIKEYRRWCLKQEKGSRGKGARKMATVNRYLSSLRGLLNWAKREEYLVFVPNIKMGKEQREKKEVNAGFAELLTFIDELTPLPGYQKAMAFILANTSMRWGSARKLRFKSLGRGETITYRSDKTTSEKLTIPLFTVTIEALEEFFNYPVERKEPDFESLPEVLKKKNPDDYLFVSYTGEPYTTMRHALDSASEKAGFRLTAHDFRRIGSSEVYRITKNLDLAVLIGQWSSREVFLAHYLQVNPAIEEGLKDVNSEIQKMRGQGGEGIGEFESSILSKYVTLLLSKGENRAASILINGE